jgi:hypothetical protein
MSRFNPEVWQRRTRVAYLYGEMGGRYGALRLIAKELNVSYHDEQTTCAPWGCAARTGAGSEQQEEANPRCQPPLEEG